MKLPIILTGAGIFLAALTAQAQYAQDALRFSQTVPNGSARFQAMGGAQTALGADVTSISGNPAGLGFFRRSEWSISPALMFTNTNSRYPNADGSRLADGRSNFNIANASIVFSNSKDDIIPGAWRGGSFGISYNRMNNFQNRFSYAGTNQRNSFLDFVIEEANGIPAQTLENEFLDNRVLTRAGAAYNTFLINPFDDDPLSYYRFHDGGGEEPFIPPVQNSTVTTTGAQYQWNFSYGGNFDDRLYFGASLGISRLRYGFREEYQESFPGSDIINNFRYQEELDVRGTGVNLSAGLIYRVNDLLRLGVSATTPTYYFEIRENYTSGLTPNYQDIEFLGVRLSTLNNVEVRTEPLEYRYNLTTPFRVSGGAAFFLGKAGFISTDVELVAFNTMRLNAQDNFGGLEQELQETIRLDYRPAINARVGGELRQDIFRFRGGIAYQGDPYVNREDNLNRQRLNFSVGAGIRLPDFYIDGAIVHSRFNSRYSPYSVSAPPILSGSPFADIRNNVTTAVITCGVFF